MKEILKDWDFNLTLRVFFLTVFSCFLIFNIKSCECEKIKKCTEIEELKKTGLR